METVERTRVAGTSSESSSSSTSNDDGTGADIGSETTTTGRRWLSSLAMLVSS